MRGRCLGDFGVGKGTEGQLFEVFLRVGCHQDLLCTIDGWRFRTGGMRFGALVWVKIIVGWVGVVLLDAM